MLVTICLLKTVALYFEKYNMHFNMYVIGVAFIISRRYELKKPFKKNAVILFSVRQDYINIQNFLWN